MTHTHGQKMVFLSIVGSVVMVVVAGVVGAPPVAVWLAGPVVVVIAWLLSTEVSA